MAQSAHTSDFEEWPGCHGHWQSCGFDGLCVDVLQDVANLW